MEDILRPNGLYNPSYRFAFTNITDEDFISFWGGQAITVKPGKTVELTHHLACKMVKELVDQIIIGKIKLDETTFYAKNPNMMPNTYRAPNLLGSPAVRKTWEDLISRQLAADEESPSVQVMRAELKAELEANLNKESIKQPVHVPVSLTEFADINNKEVKEVKEPLRVKEVKAEK